MGDRPLDEEFDTQMDVERNPCGAWQAIHAQAAEITRLSGRICVNCDQHAPASHDRRLPWPGCNAPDACTFDMTLDEAVSHHRQIAHARREEITRLQARLEAADKLAEAVQDAADASLMDEIPEGYFEDDAPDFNRGYDAAIRKVRAALSAFQEGGK